MVVKAVHLLKSLEQVERDLNELTSLKMTIQSDRKYADRLQTSLKEEEMRLEGLRKKLLSQVVKGSPAPILAGQETAEITIHVPEKKKTVRREKSEKKELTDLDEQTFRFRYQKSS
ncbi:MAG: hypothetical protein HS115_04935 [Spirochaetales bacterium]|nr:hypothetical protein [Spirochaetales bacterium]